MRDALGHKSKALVVGAFLFSAALIVASCGSNGSQRSDQPSSPVAGDLINGAASHGPYVIAPQEEIAVRADASEWERKFSGWRHEEVSNGDGGSLGFQFEIPKGLVVQGSYATRSVSENGESLDQSYEVEFLDPGGSSRLSVHRFAFVAERWPDGIGVNAPTGGGPLLLELVEVSGHPALLERPTDPNAQLSTRLRWVSDNVETVVESVGLPVETILRVANEIDATDPDVATTNSSGPTR